MNRDRIACGEGHFERLVETRVEVPFGVGFLGHAAKISAVRWARVSDDDTPAEPLDTSIAH